MAYDIILKNQSGVNVTHTNTEEIAVPRSNGDNALFSARYNVSIVKSENVSVNGSVYASHGCGYGCKLVANSGYSINLIKIKLNDTDQTELVEGMDYYIVTEGSSKAIVILGDRITADVTIETETSIG